MLSCFSSVWLFATLWTVACQAPLSMRFSRQYWSGLPCPPPGVLPDPGIEPRSPTLQADSLPAEPPEKQSGLCYFVKVVWTNWYTYLLHILKHPYENIWKYQCPRGRVTQGAIVSHSCPCASHSGCFLLYNEVKYWHLEVEISCRQYKNWASLLAQMVKNLPAMQETRVHPWVGNILWRREQQPTPVFLPGESHGQRSLMGYSPWGHKESDTTEWLSTAQQKIGRGSESQKFCSTDLINAKTRVQNSGNYLDL